ncbi:MAG: STAS domain-containing protein [Anaerolineae bacterium]|nr:STAS domain-containing protein [Anaerolineae bacterium]
MDINIETYDQATVIAINGQLNATTTSRIQDDVLSAAQSGQRILLDMSHVTYLSSAGLRMLLLLYRRIRENHGFMVLTGLSEEVTDIMQITGFLDLFSIFDNRATGLQALKKAG